MKIHLLKPDMTYRLMYPEDSVYESEGWEFDCTEIVEWLPQFQAYFDKRSEKPLPDIAYIGMSTFAFREDVAAELVDILEDSCELLPFYVEGELWYLLNVRKCIDALDSERSKYKINDGKIKLHLTEYYFEASKLDGATIFKIPNDNKTQIFCVDQRDTDEQVLNNLFCAVSAHKYTGIKFEEVFSD
jgi:hypothetical protein